MNREKISGDLAINSVRRAVYQVLVVVNIVIMLFPPIYLVMANGNMTLALVYFLGSAVLLIVSMFILSAISGERV